MIIDSSLLANEISLLIQIVFLHPYKKEDTQMGDKNPNKLKKKKKEVVKITVQSAVDTVIPEKKPPKKRRA